VFKKSKRHFIGETFFDGKNYEKFSHEKQWKNHPIKAGILKNKDAGKSDELLHVHNSSLFSIKMNIKK
jgi:hypothetical protein